MAIFSRRYANVFADPYYTFYRTIVTRIAWHPTQEVRRGVRSCEIEDSDFLLLAAGKQIICLGGQCDTADDVIVRERMKRIATICIPELAVARENVNML
jgi:hypothetical protein